MPVNKDLPPMAMDGDELVIGRGANAIRVKGENLKVQDASTHVRGHYPDMYPWDTPHRHPEWDVRRNHACDLAFPPDNIPVAALPGAIRELKRLAIGGWIVNAPVREDLLEGAVVRWDATQEMWVAALAGDLSSPSDKEEEKPGCGCCNCPIPPLPDSDLPQDVPSKPIAPVKLPCTDFDPRLDKAPSEAFQPAFMGVVISGNGVQTHGVVRHPSFNFPARTPLYLSATEPGRVTTENTGVFVGTVLVPGVLLLNVYAQILDNYLVLVKEELKSKIECSMKQLIEMSEKLGEAIASGDAANAEALQKLNGFIVGRLQELQSFLDTVNRQYDQLLQDMQQSKVELEAFKAELGTELGKGGRGYVVNTIAGREELKNAPQGTVVFVRDASGDPAVSSGPATYILVGTGADGYWANITSSISIDGGDLGDIDAVALQNAIEKAHGHDNKTLLDSITSFGEHGVKIGDVVVIHEDGSFAGGISATTPIPTSDEPGSSEETTVAQMAKDVAVLKNTSWVIALEEEPTEENFAELTKDVPDGGLYSVPTVEENAPSVESLSERESGSVAGRRLFVKKGDEGIPITGELASEIISNLMLELEKAKELAMKDKMPNSELWILESGTFTAPVSGLYDVLLFSGGNSGGVASDIGRCWGGVSGRRTSGTVYLTEGQQVPVIVGAGGVASSAGAEVGGGETSFGDFLTTDNTAHPDGPENYSYFRGEDLVLRGVSPYAEKYPAIGGGPGSGYPTDPKTGDTQAVSNARSNAAGHFGGGGAAMITASKKYSAGAGAPGSIRVRWHDPDKMPSSSQNPSEGE